MKISLCCSKSVIPGLYVNFNHYLLELFDWHCIKVLFFCSETCQIATLHCKGMSQGFHFPPLPQFLTAISVWPFLFIRSAFFSLQCLPFPQILQWLFLLMQSINEREKCDVRWDFTLVLNHKFTWKEKGLTLKWQMAGLDTTMSSASLLGSDLSLHSHCVGQDCSVSSLLTWWKPPSGRPMHGDLKTQEWQRSFLMDWKDQKAAGAALILNT